MPASGPQPGTISSTALANGANFAGSPTIRTSEVTERDTARARANRVRPSNVTKALSVPMRVLLPPARINAAQPECGSMRRSYNGRGMRQLAGRSASNGDEGTLQKPGDSKNLCLLADTKKGLRTSHFLCLSQSKQLSLRHLVPYK